MKRLFSGGLPFVALVFLLAGGTPARAQMCPFSMRSQVSMQMTWQMQMQQQQYSMGMQQQAMMNAQMQMRMQAAGNRTMFAQRNCFPAQNGVQFQNANAQQFVHAFRPGLTLHQVNRVTPQFGLQRQTLTANLMQLHMRAACGPGHGIPGQNLVLARRTIAQQRLVPTVHFQQHTNRFFTPQMQHNVSIVRVGQQRRNEISRPGTQVGNPMMRVAAGPRANATMTVRRTPPAKYQQTLTRNTAQHRPSVKLRITTTMTCGNCHATSPERPTLVLNRFRGPDIVALVPPVQPDVARLRLPRLMDVPAIVQPRVNVPQRPALARIPVADALPMIRIPVRAPGLIATTSPNEDKSSVSRAPALPSLSSTSSSSMKCVSQLTSCMPKKATQSSGARTNVALPPELPALAGEVTQTTSHRTSEEASPQAVAVKDDTLEPDDLLHPPALPSLVPPGPSMSVEVTMTKLRVPSLAEIIAQAPALPALRP